MATKATAAKPAPAPVNVPAGYETVGGDVVGFWDGESAIHVIPLDVRLTDSNIDKSKVSALITCRLVDAATVFTGTKEERKSVEAKPGDLVGIWGRPGLIELSKREGVKCFIVPAGEKKLKGKPSPMKCFDVKVPRDSKRSRLSLADDLRKESASVESAWLPTASASADAGSDNVPF